MSLSLDNPENLKRDISSSGLSALVLNGLIGAGIFALPSAVASRTGEFSPFMYIICGLMVLPVVLSFSEAARFFDGTGGPVLYAKTAFGSIVGFQTGWLLYIGRVTALAANSNKLVDYAALLWPWLGEGVGRTLTIVAIFLLFAAVNVVGVRRGAEATNLLTILKLTPLLLFIGFGISYIRPAQLVAFSPPSYDSVADTMLLVVYAFVGFEGAVVPAGEARAPKNDMPRALLVTLGFTTCLYVLVQTVCVAVLPGLAETKTPLADVARVMTGQAGTWIMTCAAIASIAGNLSAIVLTAPRMTYAMAQDNALPAWFGSTHKRYKTPAGSILFLAALGLALAVSGTFVLLAIMSTLTRMLGYMVCLAAVPGIKKAFSRGGVIRPGWRSFLIPGSGFLLCLWLAAYANLYAWLMTGAFVGLGFVLYATSRRASVGGA
ncbi:MAG: APC family permease [bacterium]